MAKRLSNSELDNLFFMLSFLLCLNYFLLFVYPIEN